MTSTIPSPYLLQCVEDFIADRLDCKELEQHWQDCPECQGLNPRWCPKAEKIVERINQPKD